MALHRRIRQLISKDIKLSQSRGQHYTDSARQTKDPALKKKYLKQMADALHREKDGIDDYRDKQADIEHAKSGHTGPRPGLPQTKKALRQAQSSLRTTRDAEQDWAEKARKAKDPAIKASALQLMAGHLKDELRTKNIIRKHEAEIAKTTPKKPEVKQTIPTQQTQPTTQPRKKIKPRRKTMDVKGEQQARNLKHYPDAQPTRQNMRRQRPKKLSSSTVTPAKAVEKPTSKNWLTRAKDWVAQLQSKKSPGMQDKK